MSSEIKAVLVKLSIKIVPNARQDPETTDEVLLQKALGRGAGKWVKYLLPETAFKKVREAGGEFRRRNYDLTLPWEEGYRLLPANGHTKYEAEFEKAKAVFNAALDEFGMRYHKDFVVASDSPEAKEFSALVDSITDRIKGVRAKKQLAKKLAAKKSGAEKVKLPCLVDQARLMHNGEFNESLYPEWRFMRQKFAFEMAFTPVPQSAHFITKGFAQPVIDEMRTRLEADNTARLQAAVTDTYNRLMKPVQDIAQKLTGKDPIFRDSLIGNVKEVLDLIPTLNLTNDAELSRLAKEVQDNFANLNPDELRENVDIRKKVTASAKKLVASFGQIGKRRFA
jgi:hypothetical protein